MTADYDEADVEAAVAILYDRTVAKRSVGETAEEILLVVGSRIAAKARADAGAIIQAVYDEDWGDDNLARHALSKARAMVLGLPPFDFTEEPQR